MSRINGSVQRSDEWTWEQHYRMASKLGQDALRLPQRTEANAETLQWALFHATMAACKVTTENGEAWHEQDIEWWRNHEHG